MVRSALCMEQISCGALWHKKSLPFFETDLG